MKAPGHDMQPSAREAARPMWTGRMPAHMPRALIVIAGLVVSGAFAAGPEDLPFHLSSSLPKAPLKALANDPRTREYALVAHLNPFYVHGDFNGDGRTDMALLVRHKQSGKLGIAILHSGARSAVILGAGRQFGNGGDDFTWMDAWHLYPRAPVQRGASGRAPPQLRGDALMVIKTESASALVYWNGKRYAWYQQGD